VTEGGRTLYRDEGGKGHIGQPTAVKVKPASRGDERGPRCRVEPHQGSPVCASFSWT